MEPHAHGRGNPFAHGTNGLPFGSAAELSRRQVWLAAILRQAGACLGKGGMMKRAVQENPPSHPSASSLIDARIKELGDWRGETLGRLRALIKAADPQIVEAW